MTYSKPATTRRHTSAKQSGGDAPDKANAEQRYHPYVNHAACVEHQQWWRSPSLSCAALVAAALGLAGLISALVFVPELSYDSHKMSVVPFANPDGLPSQNEAQFEQVCKHAQTLVNSGHAAAGLTEFKRAEAMPEVSEKLRAELFNDMAIAVHSEGQGHDSVNYLEKAIKADPQLIAARNNLATILAELGDKEKAVVVLQDALRVQPNNSCLIKRLAKLTGTNKL